MEYKIDRKSLQKISMEFRSVASRLIGCHFDESEPNLKRLMLFIEGNPLIKDYIHQQLQLVDEPLKLYKEQMRWVIPIDKPKEIVYTYTLLKNASDNATDYTELSDGYALGSASLQDELDGFNKSVVQPFINHIVDYLQILMLDAGIYETNTTTVNISDGGNYFAGNIHQSMVAIGGSTITDSTIKVNSEDDLLGIIKSLESHLSDVEESDKARVQEALQVLVQSVSGRDVPKAELAKNVEIVGNASPTLRTKLEDVAANAIGALTSHGLITAIQFIYAVSSKM